MDTKGFLLAALTMRSGMRTMRLTTFVLASLFFFPAMLCAQSSELSSTTATDSLSGSDKTIYFFLVNQVALTYQFCVSEHHAWNISADVTGSVSTESHNITPVSQGPLQSVDQRTLSLSLSPQSKWFINSSSDPVRLFVAVGPMVKFSYYYQRSYIEVPYTPSSTRTITTWEVGVLLTCGLEVRVIDLLSLAAKYDLSGTYAKSKSQNDWFGAGYDDDIKRWTYL